MRVKEESKKAGSKLNIQEMKIMPSGPITSWKIDGKKWKQWQILFWRAPKFTADGDCSHEIKRRFPLGRKAMKNLGSLLKSRDVTFQAKIYNSQICVFSSNYVQIWELDHTEGWASKNWCLRTMVLEKTLFGQLMQRANSLEKTLMLGKIEGKRRRGWYRMRRLDGITDWMDNWSLSNL